MKATTNAAKTAATSVAVRVALSRLFWITVAGLDQLEKAKITPIAEMVAAMITAPFRDNQLVLGTNS